MKIITIEMQNGTMVTFGANNIRKLYIEGMTLLEGGGFCVVLDTGAKEETYIGQFSSIEEAKIAMENIIKKLGYV